MDIIKISLLGICGVILGFLLKGTKPEYAAFVTKMCIRDSHWIWWFFGKRSGKQYPETGQRSGSTERYDLFYCCLLYTSEIGENELLVVSFGTSYNDSRVEDIKGIEDALQEAYPDWAVRRAFTCLLYTSRCV